MTKPKPLPRLSTGLPEFDRILGGGLVRGSSVLLGGPRGVGITTLLLQATVKCRVLFSSGEQSKADLMTMAKRVWMGRGGSVTFIGVEDYEHPLDIEAVVKQAEKMDILLVNSLQTARVPNSKGKPGSPAQVKAVARYLADFAKEKGVAVIATGHLRPDGGFAGGHATHFFDVIVRMDLVRGADGHATDRRCLSIDGHAAPEFLEMTEKGLKTAKR